LALQHCKVQKQRAYVVVQGVAGFHHKKSTMPKINRNFTQDQETALATEVVDGEIWIEVRPFTCNHDICCCTLTAAPQKQAGAPLIQVRLFKGLPTGTKGKFWNAVAINLNSPSWSSDFPAPAVAVTCETNWTRMLATRVLQQQALKRNAGNAKACAAGGGNPEDWVSGAGDQDESAAAAPAAADLDDNGVPVSSSKAKQEKIDSLLDAYLTQSSAFHGANGGAASGAAVNAQPSKKSGQPGEDLSEVEASALGDKPTSKKAKKDPLPGPTSVERAQEHAMQQSSHFASGFASIAESFKPDATEVFEAKAKAIATHIGITSDPAYIMCLISY
jgi:hypothetical protein